MLVSYEQAKDGLRKVEPHLLSKRRYFLSPELA
jgi:hypothetical protein